MFYPTELDDETTLYLEAEASGAFAKNDLEERPSPLTALRNAVKTAETFSRYLAEGMKPVCTEKNMEAEVSFSIRIDGNGTFMIGQSWDRGQILCKLHIRP